MLLGYARHGKDTVADILRDEYGYTFKSSSWILAESILFPALRTEYGYATVDECFADRHNHRAEWFDLINAYNTPDLARLGRKILTENDMYVGLRNREEFEAIRAEKLFDVCLWVDASRRVPPESESSCTVHPFMADWVVDNNGTLEDLRETVKNVMRQVQG